MNSEKIQATGVDPMFAMIGAQQAIRVVALVVAVTVVPEVGRLSPSDHSWGSSIRRGGITKAGSVLVRRMLIEGAWISACQHGSAESSTTENE